MCSADSTPGTQRRRSCVRLERYDVDVEAVDAGVAGAAVRHADVVLVEALAVDSKRAVVPIGSSTIASAASAFGREVWIVAGVGRRLPAGFLDAMSAKVDASAAEHDAWELDVEVIPTSMFTHVVGPHGKVPMGCPPSSPSARWPTNSSAPATSLNVWLSGGGQAAGRAAEARRMRRVRRTMSERLVTSSKV